MPDTFCGVKVGSAGVLGIPGGRGGGLWGTFFCAKVKEASGIP